MKLLLTTTNIEIDSKDGYGQTYARQRNIVRQYQLAALAGCETIVKMLEYEERQSANSIPVAPS